MEMKRVLLLSILIVGLTSSVYAQDFGVGNGNGDLEASTARDLFSSDEMNFDITTQRADNWPKKTFDVLKSEYDKGTEMSQETLTGEWRLVSERVGIYCEHYHSLLSNYIDQNTGKVNSDRSRELLKFGFTQSKNESDSIFSVYLLNLGLSGLHQGPYQVNAINPHFDRFTYIRTDVNEDIFLKYSCKSVQGSSNVMVCALKLEANSKYASEETIKCAQQPTALMIAYIKNK